MANLNRRYLTVVEKSEESVLTDEKEEQIEPEIIDIIDEEDHIESNEESTEESSLEDVTRLQQEKDEMAERILRIQAEFDNFKKRTQRERIAERKYKSQDLVTELLPALDNFERALEVEVTEETKGIVDGITMVYNQIKAALESEEIEIIETVGKEFDPNLHHAVMQVEDPEQEPNVIVEELQKGYILKDRVIRAAMVKVNK